MDTGHSIIKSLCIFVGAFLSLSLVGCAQNPVTGSHDFVMLSQNDELKIGRSNHPKIIEQYGYYPDQKLQDYVQAVGERLARVSHRKELIYRFTVLDSPVINAFALPGGYIYITRGLMSYLNSEAQLAAVLGHEIGHVTARHGVRQQSASQIANLGYTLGSILVPELRSAGSQQLFNILGGALLSGYGRDHELEADGLGAEYLARSNYDPKAMIDVIRVLKNQELFAAEQAKKQGKKPQGYHGLFASHPDNDTRLQGVVAAAKKYKASAHNVVKRNEYLASLEGMAFGDSEQQGVRVGRHFYHSGLAFSLSFPEGWLIHNNANSVQALANNGDAFIEMRVEDINRHLTPQQFITQRLKVKNLISGQNLNKSGLKGYTGIITAKDKVARVSVVYLDEHAFIFFSSVKSSANFKRFDRYFIDTASSFHRLASNEMRYAKGLKIDIVTIKASDNYKKWAAQSPIPNSPLTQLRLLNDDYPKGELVSGQRAKRIK